jgi:hypothetical protein
MTIDLYVNSLRSKAKVSGLTHNYYRYPARFSPEFVRENIIEFSNPVEYILDAFMGGGTTIVEAIANGRNAIGFDVSPLAYFITKVKTTPLSETDKQLIIEWASRLNLNVVPDDEIQADELRNVPNELRDIFIYIAREVKTLELPRQRNFAKCVLLRLGQWILDCQSGMPSTDRIQIELVKFTHSMIAGLDEFVSTSKESGIAKNKITSCRELFVGSIDNLRKRKILVENRQRIKLILTSPPYPGVHVLYHRWQVNSRKETAAPFFLAGLKDGNSEPFYTLGGRSIKGQSEYFYRLRAVFQSLKDYISEDALVVQLVAFADMERHLPEFLKAMNDAGYEETFPLSTNNRVSRQVPNRKWYTALNDVSKQQASTEIVLFHRLR